MEYDNNKNSIDRAKLVSENEALTELKNQLDYISGYPDYLKGIDEEAVQMSIISIFSEENSLSKLNIEKTVEDYSALKSVELEIGNDKPLTFVLEFDLAHYLMLFFVIVLVLALLLLVMLSMTTTDKIYYSGADGIINTFYREYGGEVTEKSEQYVRNLETEISDVESEYEKACKDYAEKTITDEEYEKSVLKNDAFDSKREALN